VDFMSAIGKIAPANKVDQPRRVSSDEINEFVKVMYVTARRVFERATTVAELCEHECVERTHLLAAMLPADTFESASGVPQILSGAGLDADQPQGPAAKRWAAASGPGDRRDA
jgi:hypothetical protein